jgi:hypothetical protein
MLVRNLGVVAAPSGCFNAIQSGRLPKFAHMAIALIADRRAWPRSPVVRRSSGVGTPGMLRRTIVTPNKCAGVGSERADCAEPQARPNKNPLMSFSCY